MTSTVNQAVLAGLGAGVLAASALLLARRGLLRLRYALGWLAVAGCIAALAFLATTIKPLASYLGFTPTGLLLVIASGILLLITLQLSIAVSGVRDDLQTVAESTALLEERLRRLERLSELELEDVAKASGEVVGQ